MWLYIRDTHFSSPLSDARPPRACGAALMFLQYLSVAIRKVLVDYFLLFLESAFLKELTSSEDNFDGPSLSFRP